MHPADTARRENKPPARITRSRSNTAHGYADRFHPVEEEPEPEREPPRITIPKLASRSRSPGLESPGGRIQRPSYSRQSTFENSNGGRDDSPARRLTRTVTDSSIISSGRGNLRPVRQTSTFADDYEDDYASSNSHGYRRDRSPPSPDRSSQGSSSVMSQGRAASWSTADISSTGKKAPPPPPPSRAKKPPPPPPPMKRSALSASEVTRY